MGSAVNIEEIMQEIRKEIKEKGLTSDMLSFEDIPFSSAEKLSKVVGIFSQEAKDSLGYINYQYSVQPYKELHGNYFKIFIKKVIRKLIKFYIEPIVFEQNNFNAHVVRFLNAVETTFTQPDNQFENLKQALERVEVLELQQKELLRQIEQIKKNR